MTCPIIKSAPLTVLWDFEIDCPYCKAEINLVDQDADGCFSQPIFDNKWDDVVGSEVVCPVCGKEFTISKVEC